MIVPSPAHDLSLAAASLRQPTSEPAEANDSPSFASLSFDGDGGLTLWSDAGTMTGADTSPELKLQIQPERPVVVGRQQGGEVPYLDPRYIPTHVLPDTNRSVLTMAGDGKDTFVSRGHFLLRGVHEGILLLNGVPQRGGGVRAPLNGTWMLEPDYRRLGDCEEFFIANGTAAKIHLPNGTTVLIRAG